MCKSLNGWRVFKGFQMDTNNSKRKNFKSNHKHNIKMSNKSFTKTVVLYDTELDLTISTDVKRERKLSESTVTKERYLGTMIEEHHELNKALKNKKMSFKELIHFLNKR